MTKPILETDRLILRPFRADDLDLVLEMHLNPEVMRFISGPTTIEDNQATLPYWVDLGKDDPNIGIWVMIEKDSQRKIGTIALIQLPENEEETIFTDHVEIGYRSIPESWGKGYTTEAGIKILEYAFKNTDLNEVVACTDHDNHASQAVLRKIGLVDKGSFFCYGEDLPFFAITKEKWEIENGYR